MSDPTALETRARIITNARAIIWECDEGIRDTEIWNGHNTDQPPIDFEELRVTRAEMIKVLQQFGERR